MSDSPVDVLAHLSSVVNPHHDHTRAHAEFEWARNHELLELIAEVSGINSDDRGALMVAIEKSNAPLAKILATVIVDFMEDSGPGKLLETAEGASDLTAGEFKVVTFPVVARVVPGPGCNWAIECIGYGYIWGYVLEMPLRVTDSIAKALLFSSEEGAPAELDRLIKNGWAMPAAKAAEPSADVLSIVSIDGHH